MYLYIYIFLYLFLSLSLHHICRGLLWAALWLLWGHSQIAVSYFWSCFMKSPTKVTGKLQLNIISIVNIIFIYIYIYTYIYLYYLLYLIGVGYALAFFQFALAILLNFLGNTCLDLYFLFHIPDSS